MKLSYTQQFKELELCIREQFDEATADYILFNLILDYFERLIYENKPNK